MQTRGWTHKVDLSLSQVEDDNLLGLTRRPGVPPTGPALSRDVYLDYTWRSRTV